jgi:hypothetical protein
MDSRVFKQDSTYPEKASSDGKAHASLTMGQGVYFGAVCEWNRALARGIKGYGSKHVSTGFLICKITS